MDSRHFRKTLELFKRDSRDSLNLDSRDFLDSRDWSFLIQELFKRFIQEISLIQEFGFIAAIS